MRSGMPENNSPDILSFPGLQDYNEIWELQKRLNEAVGQGRRREAILMLEHKPVYTLGFHGDASNFHPASDASAPQLIRIERGGDITYHGPGQLVVYPIIDLWSRRLGVKDFVGLMEQAVIDLLTSFGMEGRRVDGRPGVWCSCSGAEKKICALGIKVRRGVTMHGLALNVTTDLEAFRAINPCGFESSSVISMDRLALEAPDKREVRKAMASSLLRLLEAFPFKPYRR